MCCYSVHMLLQCTCVTTVYMCYYGVHVLIQYTCVTTVYMCDYSVHVLLQCTYVTTVYTCDYSVHVLLQCTRVTTVCCVSIQTHSEYEGNQNRNWQSQSFHQTLSGEETPSCSSQGTSGQSGTSPVTYHPISSLCAVVYILLYSAQPITHTPCIIQESVQEVCLPPM